MRHFIYVVLLYILVVSCSKTSTFVPDRGNSQLPEYSESGRNIGGALFNDTTWRSDVYISSLNGVYMKGFWIDSNLSGDSTIIIFNGKYSYHSIPFIDTLRPTSLDFIMVLRGLKIEDQDSLLNLNGKTFYFDDQNRYVTLEYSFLTFPIKKQGTSSGSITFDKVKKDKSLKVGTGILEHPFSYRYIVSGRFDFTINGLHDYHIKDGRFDMVVFWRTNLSIE